MNGGSATIYRNVLTGILLHRAVSGPLPLLCDFYEVFAGAVIPRWIHTDGAVKGPLCSPYSKAAEFSMAQQICWYSWDQFSPECQVCTFHATECRPGSFPTPTQLLLSIFSTVVGSQILPVHSLVSAVSTIPCQVRPPNCKKFPYDGQEQEDLVNIGPPPPPELRLHNSSLRTSGQQKNRYALRTSILLMFLDHPVKPQNPTEMMCHRGIRVENCLCSIRRSIEGLMRSGKD